MVTYKRDLKNVDWEEIIFIEWLITNYSWLLAISH